GIAHALLLAEDFVNKDNMTVVLCDNIFEQDFKKSVSNFKSGARIFLKKVPDPQRFGVATVQNGKVVKIVEKPKRPETQLAVTGIYQYDANVFEYIRSLKPSVRGELEISDVNNIYIKKNKMQAEVIKGFWSDAGTFDSLAHTIKWVTKKNRN
ncbi:MAG: sugar phosphate nucleotidyltransferase, partial [bacterium]|nr:sugar phosphate nucleotidyltransferase [bacterium]